MEQGAERESPWYDCDVPRVPFVPFFWNRAIHPHVRAHAHAHACARLCVCICLYRWNKRNRTGKPATAQAISAFRPVEQNGTPRNRAVVPASADWSNGHHPLARLSWLLDRTFPWLAWWEELLLNWLTTSSRIGSIQVISRCGTTQGTWTVPSPLDQQKQALEALLELNHEP